MNILIIIGLSILFLLWLFFSPKHKPVCDYCGAVAKRKDVANNILICNRCAIKEYSDDEWDDIMLLTTLEENE